LEKARKKAREEMDAMSDRARKKAEQAYSDINIPIRKPK